MRVALKSSNAHSMAAACAVLQSNVPTVRKNTAPLPLSWDRGGVRRREKKKESRIDTKRIRTVAGEPN